MTSPSIPKECDYLIVGAGATGVAFCDSLLQGNTGGNMPKIVMVDAHASPGGQWHDSYDFVQLHQPSAGYGVESTPLEPSPEQKDHLATRREILEYYRALIQTWEASADFTFVGNATLDLDLNANPGNPSEHKDVYSITTLKKDGQQQPQHTTIKVRKRLVDARYLQPDLPIHVKPKFTLDPHKIKCIPVNELVTLTSALSQKFVVIGGGKTGMDAVYYLLTRAKVPPTQIVWVVPNEPWITARENIGNCMELLHTAIMGGLATHQTSLQDDPTLFQNAFVQWHQQGKVYRLFDFGNNEWPTKFQDATLSKDELATLRQIPATNILHGQGRIQRIRDNGDLEFQNGTVVELPWKNDNADTTIFVHCSAGAFNYTHHTTCPPRPVFDSANKRITLQDVYGTPGFCFVGSILGKLESVVDLKDEDKNHMCRAPVPPTGVELPALGPSGGDVLGKLSSQNGWVQRLCNLKAWLQTPSLREWLVGHRLFNLGHYKSADDIESLVNETYNALKDAGIIVSE